MKHILVVSGSPRPKGNTYKITKLIEEKMATIGDLEFEYLVLKKLNLKYCQGLISVNYNSGLTTIKILEIQN